MHAKYALWNSLQKKMCEFIQHLMSTFGGPMLHVILFSTEDQNKLRLWKNKCQNSQESINMCLVITM